MKQMGAPRLELIVTVININPGYNEQLMKDCRDLREYSIYTDRVRRYSSEMPIQQAVERSVEECIAEGILAEFLSENKAEVIEVSIFEYNEELHFEGLRQEGYEAGISQSVIELLKEKGEIPTELYEQIRQEVDIDILNRRLKLAAKVESVNQFKTVL